MPRRRRWGWGRWPPSRGGPTSCPRASLTQLRTLDFGEVNALAAQFCRNSARIFDAPPAVITGPFANASRARVVHHPKAAGGNGGAGGLARPWASLGFTGYAGVVTGWTPDLSLSQKVDDLYGHPGRPAGAYAGRAVSFVIRDVLEGSSSLEDAETIINDATRTWGVWLGLGAAGTRSASAPSITRTRVGAVFRRHDAAVASGPAWHRPDAHRLGRVHRQASAAVARPRPHAAQGAAAPTMATSPPPGSPRTCRASPPPATFTSPCTISRPTRRRRTSRLAPPPPTAPSCRRTRAHRRAEGGGDEAPAEAESVLRFASNRRRRRRSSRCRRRRAGRA